MKKKVMVVVSGIHRHAGVKGEQTTRTEAEGLLETKDGVHTVEYEEYLEEDAKGEAFTGGVATYNRVTIAPSYMEIIRQGSVESTLRFVQGESFTSSYRTAYGEMRAKTDTRRYAVYTLEKGRRIIAEAEYEVAMNGLAMSEAEMRIDITER